jgi:hypothetical protein
MDCKLVFVLMNECYYFLTLVYTFALKRNLNFRSVNPLRELRIGRFGQDQKLLNLDVRTPMIE